MTSNALHRRRTPALPAEVTSFVGRRREIDDVRRLLSDCRMVTLTGPGGVGKTRLALKVADGLQRAFPDGVWFMVRRAPLRARRSPGGRRRSPGSSPKA